MDAGEITAWASVRSAGERRPDAIVRRQMNRSRYMDTGYINQQDQVRLQVEIRERVLGYMVGAFGLVAGLAWNEAIQAAHRASFSVTRKHASGEVFVCSGYFCRRSRCFRLSLATAPQV